MRISFVLPPVDMSGGIRVVSIYARALAGMGHEVCLVSPPHRRVSIGRKLKSWLTGKGWPVQKPQPSHLDGLNLNHKVIDRYRPITDSDVPDADIVIATWWETAEWVNALGGSKGVKVYFIQHHEVFEYLPVERCKATYRMPLHKIVVARWLAYVMRDEYGDADIDIVPNSIDHSQFHAPARGRQSRPTVGFLYHETRFKGTDVALEALARLRKRHPNLRVICFGSMPPSGIFQMDGCEFHLNPPQDRIRELYAACDVWLSASRSEGFNLPAMEAMACRTPVVSTRTGWPAESVRNGWNGMLADIDDVGGLVQGVEAILALTDEAWRDLSEHAFQTVASSSWEVSAGLFEAALVNACRRAGKGEVAGSCDCVHEQTSQAILQSA